MNDLYFACTDCKVYVNAGYRWAYWHLQHPGLVALRKPVDVDRVLQAPTFWTPPNEEASAWLYNEAFPSLRQFFSDHRGHHIVFWESDDLPEEYLLEWLQVGYRPSPTARFFAETLRLRDWDLVPKYDKTVGNGSLEFLLYNDEQVEAFRRAFYRWSRKADVGGTAGAA